MSILKRCGVDEATEVKILLPSLHAAHQVIVDSKARFRVLACGRRFGKTQIALDEIVTMLLDGKSVAYFD